MEETDAIKKEFNITFPPMQARVAGEGFEQLPNKMQVKQDILILMIFQRF